MFLGMVYIILPQYLLLIITTDKNIIETAIPAMQIAGVAQIFYGIGVVLANGLQAIGKTKFVMAAEVFSNLFILVPLSYFFGVYLGWGIRGAWLAMPIYIIIYSTVIYSKFRYGNWNSLKKY
jgi:MATE family multidrug resistance protein